MGAVSRVVLSSISFCEARKSSIATLSNKVATSHMELFSTWHIVSVTGKWHFKFRLILNSGQDDS